MQLARVLGSATATLKHASLKGRKLLVMQPLMADGRTADGDPLIVIDVVGAGRGETALIVNDGKTAVELTGDPTSPVQWTTLGIQDQ